MSLRIAVFFDGYLPFHEAKEGNLVLGLREAGASVRLVTSRKAELEGHAPPYPIEQVEARQLSSADVWRALAVDSVIAYTFLNRRFTPVLQAIKAAGQAVIVRADSDGRIGPPCEPRRDSVERPWNAAGMRNLARDLAWRALPRGMAARRIRHIESADAIFIESPGALANVAAFLTHWDRPELLDRFRVIPMTLTDACMRTTLPPKTRQVVAVGRWDDWRQKNTATAVRVLHRFLATRASHVAVMIGPGTGLIEKTLEGLSSHGRHRFVIAGSRSQAEVLESMAASRILFMPSNWEGFALAAGEAVCLGCSIAGSPLESLQLLAGGGRFGTIAAGFDEDALLGALLTDAARWEAGDYDPGEISAFWRARLDRRVVGAQLVALAEATILPPRARPTAVSPAPRGLQ